MSTAATSQVTAALLSSQQQKRAAGAITASGPVAPELNIGLTFEPGARVLDLVTGEEGVILAGTISHSLVQPAKPAGGQGTPGAPG